MGSPDARAYSRNKRGIAGSLIWINFDRHSLLNSGSELCRHLRRRHRRDPAPVHSVTQGGAVFQLSVVRSRASSASATIEQLDTTLTSAGQNSQTRIALVLRPGAALRRHALRRKRVRRHVRGQDLRPGDPQRGYGHLHRRRRDRDAGRTRCPRPAYTKPFAHARQAQAPFRSYPALRRGIRPSARPRTQAPLSPSCRLFRFLEGGKLEWTLRPAEHKNHRARAGGQAAGFTIRSRETPRPTLDGRRISPSGARKEIFPIW